MTVKVYKAQIADLSRRATALEKVLSITSVSRLVTMYYSCMIILAPLHDKDGT